MTRIRTLDFLPEIFQTPTNSQFLGATLDQLVNPPVTKKIEGFVGSKLGYGINAKDYYVTEPTKVRRDYQLEPGVVFTKDNETTAKDFISYPGILDALKSQGGITTDNNRLFESQFYSWDSFTNLDPLINFNEYYWLPEGPPAVTVASSPVFLNDQFIVRDLPNSYNIKAIGSGAGTDNPTITLLRGGSYTFSVNQNSGFWIQAAPGVSGYSPIQTNLYTRDVYGVTNNGATSGLITFDVPFKDAQDEETYPGNVAVGVVSTKSYAQINGMRLSDIGGGIDTVTALDGRTVLFYNTGINNEIAYVSNFYSSDGFDTNSGNLVAPITISATAISSTGNITVSSVSNLSVGSTLSFSGTSFGNIEPYDSNVSTPVNSNSLVAGTRYFISSLGNSNWIQAGVNPNCVLDAEINGTQLIVYNTVSGAFSIGQTLDGVGVTAGTVITGYDMIATANNGYPTYTVSISQTVPITNISVYDIQLGKIFTCVNPVIGNGTATEYNPVLYYVKSIDAPTNTITISQTLNGEKFVPATAATGSMTAAINQGLFEEGFYVPVNNYLFLITFVGDIDNPVLKLTPATEIPSLTKLFILYGQQYIGFSFFKNELGYIEKIPLITAPLDTLYYQDSVNANKVGVIRLIDSNELNTLNVETDILGKKNYTSRNGIVFTNGLKVTFDGDVVPRSYLSGEYYVEGVGTAIELISVESLICPETFTTQSSNPYDILPYDIGTYDAALFIPVDPDYITISRNSINKNAWSRSNRWFHIQVIEATANYLNDPSILTTYGNVSNKAKRPIIEFYPDLKLYNSGTVAKDNIDFIDTRTTDAFSQIAGQATYYPDISTYTTYDGIINTNPLENTGGLLEAQEYRITSLGELDPDPLLPYKKFTTADTWVRLGATLDTDGEFVPGVEYIIWDVGTATDWNEIAGTIGETYTKGTIFTALNSGTTVGVGGGSALRTTFTSLITGPVGTNELVDGNYYTIVKLGNTNWEGLGATPAQPGTFDPGTTYVITSLGRLPQIRWNIIADNTTNAGSFVFGELYQIKTVGTTDFTLIGASSNTPGVSFRATGPGTGTGVAYGGKTYSVGDSFVCAVPGTPSPLGGEGVTQSFSANATILPAVGTGTMYQGTGTALSLTSTTLEIPASSVTGSLTTGMYINDVLIDQASVLPTNTRILSVAGTDTLEATVFWSSANIIPAKTNASFVASTKNNADLIAFPGARVVFSNDSNPLVKDKIYVINYSNISTVPYPVITLTEAVNGQILDDDMFVVLRGENNEGKSYYYKDQTYILAQEKLTVNQPPNFDVFDENGISFGNTDIYKSTTFEGCKLFNYSVPEVGVNDSILGFPISYSSINNVGDIKFDVSLNSDTFDYVSGMDQTTNVTGAKVNQGYVHNVTSRDTYDRLLGWQTAIAPSTQYQVFNFKYTANIPSLELESDQSITFTVTCDVSQLDQSITVWPSLQVFNNNNLLSLGTDYTVSVTDNSTIINVLLNQDIDTEIQVLILSDQVSNTAYYSVPINLTNNPFNTDITTVDIGDIRGHYQTIFYNNSSMEGQIFGSNNSRDLGNLVPYGTRIIQNSASLVLPGAFLRSKEHNLFDAILFNSNEYIKFKSLLIDVVNKTDYQQQYNPSFILDIALDQITSMKNQEMPFFWSDMLPNKAVYITNSYVFYNDIDTTTYPLSKVYKFTSANYDGVLVYLQTKIQGTPITKQLYKDIDYTISPDSPSLVVTTDLKNGDKIIVKEYNQTYGSYVPNTPTKLGLYPVSIPKVIYDDSYITPTWFILGHDGSYNKLYGEYNQELGMLVDYRDQALLEFETRIYNNLKLSNTIPVQEAEVTPGYFRDTVFSYDEWLEMYTPAFLNWTGQNRLDYKTQVYLKSNQYTYNYKNTTNKLDKSLISQGNWRGIYQYYYDTTTPDQTPWEMIGYKNKPNWWDTRYGPAPWTSDNLILWTDLQDGVDYNDGAPIVIDYYKRPGLLNIIPVDDEGNLLPPIDSLIASYNSKTFQRDWTVGDDAPVEFSYRRSSSYPFDLMRLQALMRPAKFFNLGVDVDNYKYSAEFNQFLVNNRSHLVPANIEIYGSGTAKTSYINWIVDFEKQLGIGATENIKKLLTNLDVRLVFRLAGFSDKALLKFFVEKGTPSSGNASLLIPDESYQVLLYENQPTDRLMYSAVSIQNDTNGYKVFGNSQVTNYFKVLKPILNGNTTEIIVQDEAIEVSADYSSTVEIIPYGTTLLSTQEVAQFLISYGKYLESQGASFTVQESGIELNWQQMAAEFLYWVQIGWQTGSVVTLNPAANTLVIDKESQIVQPLVFQQQNFVLNQNLYPIENKDLSIFRDECKFSVTTLNKGDTVAYAQFSLSNIEHGLVFDNLTLFNDTIYNLITGLKQNRIYVRGTKSAEWNGTMFASGFIYNQDNIQEWKKEFKYTKGSIIKYKNKYWTALNIIQPNTEFNERDWKRTEYDEIQKGLLPNSSTRSYESALYYDVDKANLESDADQLSFSLIGFRQRPYMTSADLTDITQVNVYKNLIKEKGTRAILDAFKGAQLPQGGIDYQIYENWAILNGEFGGVLNSNFVEFKLNQKNLISNPSIFGLTDGNDIQGAQQLIPLYSLFNYGRQITSTNVLPTITGYTPDSIYPDAGYVNYNDVKMSSYFYSGLPAAVDKNGIIVPINRFYVRDFVWLADYLSQWQVLTPNSIGRIIQARNNLNNTTTITFAEPHNLEKYNIFAIINFDTSVNGYYVALQIVNQYQVIINLSLPSGVTDITGQGIGLKLNSQRVEKPSDVQNLPLLNNEFVKNKVWVDENTDGSWAVYEKSINYKYDEEFTRTNSVTFGSAVAFTTLGDYLLSDAGAGKVYRYQYDALTKNYEADQTLTYATSFGTTIAKQDNIFAISQPTTSPRVRLFKVNDSTINDDITAYQNPEALNFQKDINLPPIAAPVGCTNLGTGLAMSGDKNWIYVSDYDSATPIARNKIHVFKRLSEVVNAPDLVSFRTYTITSLGNTDFTLLGAQENKVGIIFLKNNVPAAGTGTATLCNYVYIKTIDGPTTDVELFGYSISTNYSGDVIIVGAPNYDYDVNTTNSGRAYCYQRAVQNIETQTASDEFEATEFELAWTPEPDLDLFPITVYKNGTIVQPDQYSISGNNLVYAGSFIAGDIITVSGNEFVLAQTLYTETTPRNGVQFGYNVASNKFGTEFLVGAPFELNDNQEGAVFRYTYGGARFGYVSGTSAVNVTTDRVLLINGYSVTIPAGDANDAAQAIINAGITNITAAAINDKLTISVINPQLVQVNSELTIFAPEAITYQELGLQLLTQTQTINCPHAIGPTQFGTTIKFNENNSFVVSAPVGTRYAQTTFDFIDDLNQDNDTIFDNNATQFIEYYPNAGAVYMFDYLENYNETLDNIGAYTYAQSCNGQDQDYGSQPRYGLALDFSENKVVIGTPYFRPDTYDGQVVVYINEVGIQDWAVLRQTNPIVDINAIQNTQLFSAETNSTLINLDYIDPLQGKLFGAIRQNIDVVSNNDPASYNNNQNTQSGFVWGADRVGTVWFDTTNVRFVNYHQNDNLYNAKYWGTVFPGSDVAVYSWVASNVQPSDYQGPGVPKDINLYTVQTIINSSNTIQPVYYFWVRNSGIIFSKTGKTLADVSLESYISNPLQSGISYMAPLSSDTFALYNSQQYVNANDTVFHVGFSTSTNDNPSHQEYQLIREDFASDFLPGLPSIAEGILEPQSLYDKLLDSLCGVNYDTDLQEDGEVVPDPFLPKAVQSGVLVRPRQSFFTNRFAALKNYLQYANSVLKLYPISEIRPNASFIFAAGEYYDTAMYWEFVNWWLPGYDDSTKSSLQVPIYADLLTLTVPTGTIVTVEQNSNGSTETYRYDNLSNFEGQYFGTNSYLSGKIVTYENVNYISLKDVPPNIFPYNSEYWEYFEDPIGQWTRIGLQNGTVRIKTEIYDYEQAGFGFGGDFFSTGLYDQYPSQETRYIIRALNEQIFTNELLIHRNKSLILLFEFIQAESLENQNYLPWLNKTSLVDVSHKIRELKPLQNYVSDNQEFLEGYVNEAKPYHVVIKEFLFDYTGTDVYPGNITDFDLPASYNKAIEKFVSPELVYNNADNEYKYLPSANIWLQDQYTEWYNNYGISLEGQQNYNITTLASYVTLSSDFLIVKNASGFPVNGTIKIASVENPNQYELITYNSVDRALNILTGLVRGVNNTEIFDHLPGENIYIDLPPVVILNTGRGYNDTPKVIAYIDTNKYPEPREEAVLEAVMSLDSVIGINVVNPGSGYAVLPEIIIGSSIESTFTSSNVNSTNNTIEMYAPILKTGDLVKYEVPVAEIVASITRSTPTSEETILNVTEIVSGNITVGSTIVGSGILENTIVTEQLSGDTGSVGTYRVNYPQEVSSRVMLSYGQNVEGLKNNQWYYVNVLEVSPLTILALYSSYADAINDMFRVSIGNAYVEGNQILALGAKASAISSSYPVRENNITLKYDRTTYNSQVTDWAPGTFYGSFFAGSYNNTNNIASSSIELASTQPPINTILASNEGLVFPVKQVDNIQTIDWSLFERNVVQISSDELVLSYESDNSDDINPSGSTVGFTLGMPVKFTGDVGPDIEIGKTYYIVEINGLKNFKISETPDGSPISLSDYTVTYVGMKCFTAQVINQGIIYTDYPGIRNVGYTNSENVVTVPLTDIGTGGTQGLYTGAPLLFTGTAQGGIKINTAYYVTAVLDDQRFTMSLENDPVRLKVLYINAANQLIMQNTFGLNVNDRVVFNNMTIEEESVTNFGGILQQNFYYVKEIGINVITLSETIGGPEVSLSPVTLSNETYCFLVSQENTANLTDNTVYLNSLQMEVALPASPGQVDGQLFTFYPTSEQYTNITNYTYSNLLERTIDKTFATSDILAISPTTGGTDGMYINFPFTVATTIGNIIAGTTYYVTNISQIIITVSYTSSSTDTLEADSTSNLYVDMPITFTGESLGGVELNEQYYVESILAGNKFKIKRTLTGTAVELTTGSGSMVGTGSPYIQVSTTKGGTNIDPGDATGPTTLDQHIELDPTLDVSYVLGGYRVVVPSTGLGEGFTIGNKITILGTEIGGMSPANDLTLIVNTIDNIEQGDYDWSLPVESNGNITSVICQGTPAGQTKNYYLKVRTSTSFDVYADPLYQIPVSGLDFGYTGYTTTSSISTGSSNTINVVSSADFDVNDPIVFTGLTLPTELERGKVYYIESIPSLTTITVTTDPGSAVISISSGQSFNMTVAKAGSFMLLPEPFYFNQSIVKYNNRVYVCVVSNNDDQFIFGKWEEINSGDRRLNALDRVKGFYQPTVNMPGTELSQLFTGLTYPYTTYKGNEFDPANQYAVDTRLQDQPFYPKHVNMTGVIFAEPNYIISANLPNSSGMINDREVTDDWVLSDLGNKPMALTDLKKAGNKYIMTSASSAHPILTSVDGRVWSANGFFVPFGVIDAEVKYYKTKLIASQLSLNAVDYNNGVYVAAGSNILYSIDGSLWRETYKFDTGVSGTIYDVKYVQTTLYTGWIAVGTKDGEKLVLYSTDALGWAEVPSTAFSHTTGTILYSVAAGNNNIVVVGNELVVYKTTNLTTWTRVYNGIGTLNNVAYADNMFGSVGDDGILLVSTDATTWTLKTTDTTENLNKIIYVTDQDRDEWTIVGDNNTVLQTQSLLGTIDWDTTQIFSEEKPAYTVQGAPFEFGYGPEELVPGIVTDQLTMLVNTRAGTNWPVEVYAHVGYNVVSIELEYNSDNEYSFDRVVQKPAQISVFKQDNSVSQSLYANVDYTVDWINKVVSLDTNISSSEILRIDVYEVGNGDQLVKSNTQTDPLDLDASGFQQTLLDCNYSGRRTNGGGIVQEVTGPINDPAISTSSSTNSILVADITKFDLNVPVLFTGIVFGGVSEFDPNNPNDTTYFVKSINTVTSRITISDTLNSGIAGPTFILSDGSGSDMNIVIQKGPGEYWSEPAVFHNGSLLLAGFTNTAIRTKASTNTIVTYNTSILVAGQTIRFGLGMFGGLNSLTTYYVKEVISGTEFTISSTIGGPEVTLQNGAGKVIYITNDYAVALDNNNITAKLLFAYEYDTDVDFISYSFFNESEPQQYGYTIPETETFVGDGTTTYYLNNYIGDDNAANAIVEINGLRIMPNEYEVNPFTNTVVFDNAIPNTDRIAVTTFNDTQRQYFNTQSEVSTTTVSEIQTVLNTINPYFFETQTDQVVTVSGTKYFVADSNSGLINGQYVMFQGTTAFGGVSIDGTMYTMVYSGTGNNFRVQDSSGNYYPSGSSSTGLMNVRIGGQPTVRVFTTNNNNLVTNDLVRIDGLQGSVQLNSNTYYVHVITPTIFDIYTEEFDPTVDAVNYPVTICDSYVSGGYVWQAYEWILENTTITSCNSLELTVAEAYGLVIGTPVYFTEDSVLLGQPTSIPEIIAGNVYYIRSSDDTNNKITISETRDGEIITFSTQSGLNIRVTQWEQDNVDRLWVTVNGQRVASSSLRLNSANEVSILSPIEVGDEIIITSMIPSATPDEETYINIVDKNNNGVVYRANNYTRTWLTQPVSEFDTVIHVKDVANITNKNIQENVITPADTLGFHIIPLVADKDDLVDVVVYNNNPARLGYIEPNYLQIRTSGLGPSIMIQAGNWIETGDVLTITTLEGKLIYIAGEYMRLESVDPITHVCDVARGVAGSSVLTYIPANTEVYSLLVDNRMNQINYNNTWNKIPGVYNKAEGDPLQIATGSGPEFLRMDVS